MKTSHTLLLGATFCTALLAFIRMPLAQEPAGETAHREDHGGQARADGKIWYFVDLENSPDLAGWSTIDPDDLNVSLAKGEYLRLNDCRTRSINGTWTADEGRHVTGTKYLRPSLVRSYVILKSDPLTWKPEDEKK